MFGVAVDGNPIMLSKIGGRVYAIDAVCSHYNGYLPRGQLKSESPGNGKTGSNAVICPVHKAEFEATTGKVIKNVPYLIKAATHKEATDLRTYEVDVVDNNIRLRL
jgi:nitrite reductase/ring-hydroxylating ferredoxin subunit